MGRIDVKVTTSPLEMSEFIGFKPSLGHGALNSFVGIVRNLNLGKNVIKMEYDCFIPLCEKTFFHIAERGPKEMVHRCKYFSCSPTWQSRSG